jgi:hypothetical protein
MSVNDGNLTLPDGMTYRVLVLPERETMTPALMHKVKDLIAAGATVIGPRPRKSPGLSGFPVCDDEIQKLADEVWGDCDGVNIMEHRYGKGRIVWKRGPAIEEETVETNNGKQLRGLQYGEFAVAANVLTGMGVPPDFDSDPLLRFTHRRDGKTEIYFLANPEERAFSARCTFRADGRQPELWDPVQGETRYLTDYRSADGRTTLDLSFEPHQSFFIIFRNPAGKTTGGRTFRRLETVAEIKGEWKVSFDKKWGGPGEVLFSRLEDWTQRPEEGIRYYSGAARYRSTFDLPNTLARSARDFRNSLSRVWLDLGTVKNLASVRLNGRELGVVWCAPWRVDISGAVKQKENLLEITVANLWPNRLIGDERQPPDAEYGKNGGLLRVPGWVTGNEARPSTGRYAFSTWKHFTGDSPLLPSGLLGPVRLFRSNR